MVYSRIALMMILLLCSWSVSAHEFTQMLSKFARSDIVKWANDPIIIKGIKDQNGKNANVTQDQITAWDKQWESERSAGNKPLIDSVLASPVSQYLKKVESASEGLFTEIFVMDNKGLNVGMSEITSDYWQGDEAKFQETYGKDPTSVHIGAIILDESTGVRQVQVSMTISENGVAIGAITVGVNPKKIP